MSAHFFIAVRYLNAKRKGLFTVITTLIGVMGVALGVAALVVTLSIMNGFQSDIKQKILDAQAYVMIYGRIDAPDYAEISKTASEIKGVVAFSPFMAGQAILSAGDRSSGVFVKGIKIPDELAINNLGKAIKHGDWTSLNSGSPSPLVVGEELAKNLGIWVGDSVVLVSPKIESSFGGIMPKMKKFRITGLVNTGYYEFDNTFVYCSLKDAVGFFGGAETGNGAGFRLENIDEAGSVAAALRKKLGFNYSVKTYADMNRNLFSALKLEKFMMSLVLGLIILVATFTIASNLLMMSVEKIKDIGILRSMGASPAFVRKVFFLEGVMIASLGIMIGLALGIGVSLFIKTYPLIELPSDIYYVTKVPIRIEFWDVFITAAGSFLLCLVSAVYPAYRASRINPIEAVRYG